MIIDKSKIINTALGIVLAAAVIFVGWYIYTTRQIALQANGSVQQVVNFLNQQNAPQQPAQ